MTELEKRSSLRTSTGSFSWLQRQALGATWNVLPTELVKTGEIGELTLRALLSRSPIIATLSPGVWGLRGVRAVTVGELRENCAA